MPFCSLISFKSTISLTVATMRFLSTQFSSPVMLLSAFRVGSGMPKHRVALSVSDCPIAGYNPL